MLFKRKHYIYRRIGPSLYKFNRAAKRDSKLNQLFKLF